jgi:hypothetical protein
VKEMTKRKAKFDAAEKNNKTPKKNLDEAEFSAEFAYGEDTAKGKNRNSKRGNVGGHNE